jgi:hypothetical protein
VNVTLSNVLSENDMRSTKYEDTSQGDSLFWEEKHDLSTSFMTNQIRLPFLGESQSFINSQREVSNLLPDCSVNLEPEIHSAAFNLQRIPPLGPMMLVPQHQKA